jgi:integrase
MIFDKNVKRAKELERADPLKFVQQIKDLRSEPEWWIDYYDATGRRRAEKSPVNTKQGAEHYFIQRKGEIFKGEYDTPEYKRAKLSLILDYYVENRSDSSTVRTMVKTVKTHIGNLTLDRIDSTPQILARYFRNFPEKKWSDKYIWNHFIVLRAAINYWLKMHRMVMSNPCDIIPELTGLAPNTNVREEVPTAAEFNRLIVTCIEVKTPQWIIDLFCAVWESGLRISEVLGWKVEDVCLDIQYDAQGNVVELPFFTTLIKKQRRITRKQIPMSFGLWEILKRVISERKEGRVWPVVNAPYKLIRKLGIMEKAELTKYRPFHDFRKSFKTEMKRQGMTKEFTKYLQGHATDSMDQYYTQFRRQDVQSAFMPGYENKKSRN